MPVQQVTASPSQYTLYNSRSQQASPINSATATPNNCSPTSPRAPVLPYLPAHTRQLRPPKSPLYIPAVLRPTDPPKKTVKQSPLTPPASRHNSFDPFENARALSRRSTGESGNSDLDSVVEDENNTDGLGKVTALPTRQHWKVCLPILLCPRNKVATLLPLGKGCGYHVFLCLSQDMDDAITQPGLRAEINAPIRSRLASTILPDLLVCPRCVTYANIIFPIARC